MKSRDLLQPGLSSVDFSLARKSNIDITSYELALPQITGPNVVEQAFNEESNRGLLREIRKKFARAQKYVVICGDFGLGDAIIQARYALLLAQKTHRPVICQVQPVLLDSLKLSSRATSISYVEVVPRDIVLDSDTFIIDLEYSLTKNMRGWGESLNMDDIRNIRDKERYYDDDYRRRFNLDLASILDKFFINTQQGNNRTEAKYALALLLLGDIKLTRKEIKGSSLTGFSASEVRIIPQDLDLLIAPDAGEVEVSKENRSRKSLDLKSWERLFEIMPTHFKIGIVQGISHPRYCRQVVDLGIGRQLNIQIIQGNLLHFAKQVLRAKHFVGVDSGTTHLAVDVVRSARRHKRDIKIWEFFNTGFVLPEDNAITEGVVAEASVFGNNEWDFKDRDIEKFQQWLMS